MFGVLASLKDVLGTHGKTTNTPQPEVRLEGVRSGDGPLYGGDKEGKPPHEGGAGLSGRRPCR
jgi:hypothetical protein